MVILSSSDSVRTSGVDGLAGPREILGVDGPSSISKFCDILRFHANSSLCRGFATAHLTISPSVRIGDAPYRPPFEELSIRPPPLVGGLTIARNDAFHPDGDFGGLCPAQG